MTIQDNDPNKRDGQKEKKPNKGLRVFLKVFLVSFVFLSAGIVFGAVNFYRNISPPEIPVTQPIIAIDTAEPIMLDDEGDEDETVSVAALTAPLRFLNHDRKELFFTFLIVGLNEGNNANTIIVASYDGVNHEANLISIPRDSLINVNRANRKLSGSFLNGMIGDGGKEGGIAQVQREVMSVIGFVPDFYVIFNYDAFKEVIDAVGGVEIYVPFHMRYDDPFQDLHIDIRPGLQHMDGETALLFARFRESNPGFRPITDYQRIENQQTVINAVLDNLVHPASILRIAEFIEIFNKNVYTNLIFDDMVWFASQYTVMDGLDAVHFHTMPTDGSSGAPMWYEFLYAPGIVRVVNATVNPFTEDIGIGDLDIIRN